MSGNASINSSIQEASQNPFCLCCLRTVAREILKHFEICDSQLHKCLLLEDFMERDMVLIRKKWNKEINSKLGFYFLRMLLDADKGETLKTFRNVLFMKRLSLGIYQRKIKAHKFVWILFAESGDIKTEEMIYSISNLIL